jgi:hypothetical protein
MVYESAVNKLVKERAHLHSILEHELWIFGEQYNMMVSERSLTGVLDRHLKILGRAKDRSGSVRRLDGKIGRVDLMLSAAATEHDRNRHLVVELKAPMVTATVDELQQVKSYAKAVAADPRFIDYNTTWDFVLVTVDMDDDVRQEARQKDRPLGLVHEPNLPNPHAHVRVWARTWSEIIEESRRRLSYFQSNLEHNPSVDHAIDYLNREYSNLIPVDMRTDHRESQETAS